MDITARKKRKKIKKKIIRSRVWVSYNPIGLKDIFHSWEKEKIMSRERHNPLIRLKTLHSYNRKKGSQSNRNMRESSEDIFLSQDISASSSQASVSSQRRTRNSTFTDSQIMRAQDMETQKEMELISSIIRYLFIADRNKQPIQKTHIVKNVLGGNGKIFRSIIESVKRQLSEVFGYKLIEVENNKYLLVNEIENHLPHLAFHDNHKQVLLYLVLVHIFMYGESCKEELLWDFLQNLGIITNDNFQHEYFGDVKELVTVEFVNQRYIEKTMINKNDPSQFEYTWGSRARNELTYRSALQFVADIYGYPINKWKLQYKTVIEEEQAQN